MSEELNASEALYGFAGWLTSRKQEVTLSSAHDAGGVARLVQAFIDQNNLPEPREGWHHILKHPEGEQGNE